jgi:hypothetical protein
MSAERRRHSERPAVRPREIVSQLKKEPNELKKKLALVGYVADGLSRQGESLFLVGGQAVETYSAGQFTTGDIDVTTTDTLGTEKILTRWDSPEKERSGSAKG